MNDAVWRAFATYELIDEVSKPARSAQKAVAGIDQAAENASRKWADLADRMEKTGGVMKSMGRPMMAAGAAIVAPVAGAVKAYADVEAAMVQSTAIMGGVTQATFDRMQRVAVETSKVTRHSAEDLAASYFYLASAGMDAEASMAALPQVARFAQAGMFDLQQATDLLTDAQTALGLTVKGDAAANLANMTRLSDVLVRANTLANASVEQFSAALTNKAAAGLRAMNKTAEEGVAVLAAFADQGLKGVTAGERLSIMLQQLPKLAVKEAPAFERYGVEIFDSQGNLKNVAEVVRQFEAATRGMSDAERAAAFESMKISEALADGLTQLIGTSDQIESYQRQLERASGFTNDVAAKNAAGLTAELGALGKSFENLGTTMAGSFGGRLAGLVSKVTAAVNTLETWAYQNPKLASAIMGVTAAVGALTFTVGGALWVFGSLASGIGGGIRAVADLGGAIGAKGLPSLGKLASSAWEAAVSLNKRMGAALLALPSMAAAAAKSLWAFTRAQVAAARASLAGALRSTWAALVALPGRLVAATVATWSYVRAQSAAAWATLTSGRAMLALGKRGLLALVGGFRSAALAARAFSLALLANPLGLVIAAVAALAFVVWKYWGPIKSFAGGLFDGLKAGLAPLAPMFATLRAAVAPLVGWFRSLFGQVTFSEESLKRFAAAGARAGVAIGTSITSLVTKLMSLANSGRRFIELFVSGIRAGAGKIRSAITSVLGPVQRLFPQSPVKEGPLTVVNSAGQRLMELFASTVTPAPLARAMGRALDAAQRTALPARFGGATFGGSLPQTVNLPTAGGAAARPAGERAPINVTFSGGITVSVSDPAQAGVAEQVAGDIQEAVRRALREIEADRERTAYR